MTDLLDLMQCRAPEPPPGVPADVAELFEKLALDVRAAGWKRYSADAILHRIRWHHRIEKGNRALIASEHGPLFAFAIAGECKAWRGVRRAIAVIEQLSVTAD